MWSPDNKPSGGLTLIELIVATTILQVLERNGRTDDARVTIKRERERQLRQALWAMRDGIDRYKDAVRPGAFKICPREIAIPVGFGSGAIEREWVRLTVNA